MRMFHQFTLTAADGGTRVEHTAEVHPKRLLVLLTPVLAMVLRRNMRSATAAFKQYLERRP
jgi:hypothetical protein